MKNTILSSALASSLLIISSASQAAGELAVNIGLGTVGPDASSNYLNNVETAASLPADSTSLDVNSDTQLAITFNYMLTDNVGLELWTATPFNHDIELSSSSALNGLKAGETKHLPPTLLAQYHFGSSADKIRPFVGAGLNYTIFFDEEVDALDSTLTGANVIPADAELTLELDPSLGLAFQAGFNYDLNETWGIHAMASWVDIDSDGEVKLNGDLLQKVNVEIDPMVFVLAARYKF